MGPTLAALEILWGEGCRPGRCIPPMEVDLERAGPTSFCHLSLSAALSWICVVHQDLGMEADQAILGQCETWPSVRATRLVLPVLSRLLRGPHAVWCGGGVQTELLFCTTIVGMPFLVGPMLATGEVFEAWGAGLAHPYVYGVVILEAFATYIGQLSVLSLIALFGAATTAMVSRPTLRRHSLRPTCSLRTLSYVLWGLRMVGLGAQTHSLSSGYTSPCHSVRMVEARGVLMGGPWGHGTVKGLEGSGSSACRMAPCASAWSVETCLAISVLKSRSV